MTVPSTFIQDWAIGLGTGSVIEGWVKLDGESKRASVALRIPELDIDHRVDCDSEGYGAFEISADVELWRPGAPRCYRVELDSESQSFEHPPWLGREVTADARYLNANLVQRPYARWSADERK